MQTAALARERGFKVDESLARAEIERVHGFYVRRKDRYLAALHDPSAAQAADPFGNFTVHAGFWLWGLAEEKTPPDEALVITTRLLASKQWDDGCWSFTDTARAPMQTGDFTTTALAARALVNYAAPQQAEQTASRLAAARQWLLQSQPRTTDDKAFRLLGLHWLGADRADLQYAAAQLLSEQRADGGFAQQDNMPTDAYATGLALFALSKSGALPSESADYQRGVAYLVSGQAPDGSWYVKTRAIPTNPYFESGFPYGKSQFISYAATCWATQALTLALDKTPQPEKNGQE